jgi:hypothetical protein
MVYGWEGLNRDARVIDKALWERGSLNLDETSVMRCADVPRVVAAPPRLCHPRFLAAKLSRTCFSLFRQGSHEFSDKWLHEERTARRHNVHLHPKRFKL